MRSISGASGPSLCSTSRTAAPRATSRRSVSARSCWWARSTPAVRLVHDQQVRRGDQGAGDQHPLLLPAGEVGDPVVGPVEQAGGVQRPVDGRCVPAAEGQHPVQRQPSGGDHLAHGRRHAARRGGALRDVADPVPGAEGGAWGAEELQFAADQRHRADHGPDGGRLAAAVAAEQRDHLAAVDREVHPVQDRTAAERGDGAAQPDGWCRVVGYGCHGDLPQVEQPSAVWRAVRFCRMIET